jgi:hypothetical protein
MHYTVQSVQMCLISLNPQLFRCGDSIQAGINDVDPASFAEQAAFFFRGALLLCVGFTVLYGAVKLDAQSAELGLLRKSGS